MALPFPGEPAGEVLDLTASAVLAHVSDLVAVVGPDGTLRAVSTSVEQRLGHRAGRLVGSPVGVLFVADPQDVPAEELDRIFLEPGAHGPVALRAMTADGRSRMVEAVIDNLLDVEEIEAVVVTAVDLTERQMLDASVSEQRALLEAIARGAEVEVIAERLVERIERWLPDSLGALLLTDATGTWRVEAAPSIPPELADALEGCEGSSPIGRALAQLPERATGVSAAEPDWFAIRGACKASGVEVLWVRPFRVAAGEEPRGAVVVVRNDRRPLSEVEVDLVEQCAHLAVIAVERRAAVETLEHRALHDDLTGLPNRTLLLDRIERALARSTRDDTQVAVLFFDLDRFKHINDSLGHAAGDAVLREVSERLLGVLRAGDTVGRLGGDEFVMVCAAISDASDALAIADRVAECLRPPISFDGGELVVRASVGVALARGSLADPELVIRNADHAMYRAKERGRDAVALFDEDDHRRVRSRVDIERALHGAQDRGELVLHFQPLVRLGDGHQVGVEALVRWERPGVGTVMPEDFIAVAEESGLIVPLGSWVIEEAFRSAAAWPEPSVGSRVQVAVNLSPRQLLAPGLLDRIVLLLDRTGVEASWVCFEVTESVLLHDEETAIETLHRLKSLGAGIAIDDFGTGHATLDYLRRFTMADVLKIDRSFVHGIGDRGSQEHAIVAASVALAHSLGIEVVAEGVETEAQLEAAHELGCDLAQGHLLGPPEHFVSAVARTCGVPDRIAGVPGGR